MLVVTYWETTINWRKIFFKKKVNIWFPFKQQQKTLHAKGQPCENQKDSYLDEKDQKKLWQW